MLYVGGLKHNLLNVSQMCDNGYDVTFGYKYHEIHNIKNEKLVGKAIRAHNNVYVFDNSRVNYFLRETNEAWLWHKRLGHMNFDNLIKVSKMGVVRGLPRLSKPDNTICKSCCLESRPGLISSQKSSPHLDLWSSCTHTFVAQLEKINQKERGISCFSLTISPRPLGLSS